MKAVPSACGLDRLNAVVAAAASRCSGRSSASASSRSPAPTRPTRCVPPPPTPTNPNSHHAPKSTQGHNAPIRPRTSGFVGWTAAPSLPLSWAVAAGPAIWTRVPAGHCVESAPGRLRSRGRPAGEQPSHSHTRLDPSPRPRILGVVCQAGGSIVRGYTAAYPPAPPPPARPLISPTSALPAAGSRSVPHTSSSSASAASRPTRQKSARPRRRRPRLPARAAAAAGGSSTSVQRARSHYR